MVFKIKNFLSNSLPPQFLKFIRYTYNLRFLIRLINIELNHDYKNTVIISGTARSGTTWLGDILNYRNEYRYMFEPFNQHEVRIWKNIGAIPYLRVGNKDPIASDMIEKVLSGRIRSTWINKYNRKLFTKRRLVKEIHINVLLKWIKTCYPEIPVILLLRHPFAVANSMDKLKWWDADQIIRRYLEQPDLVEDFLSKITFKPEKLKSDFSKYVFIWCIENIVPLSLLSYGEVYLAFYESLCDNPVPETKKIFDFLGIKWDEKVLKTIHRPSAVTREDSAIYKGKKLVGSWKEKIPPADIGSALGIIRAFGLNKIYSEDIMPDIKEANKILKTDYKL